MINWVNNMNKIMNKAKKSITNQKKKYLFLSVIMLVGIISGILFIFFISKEDKSLVKQELEIFFSNIQNKELNYLSSFINSILSNFLYLFFIWLLGISIIGIPVVIFLLFFKGFIFGFSFSSIIINYGIRGVFLSIVYQFPHNLLSLIIFLLMGFYAINFSIRLFRVLFLKENINLTLYFKRYNQIALFCIIGIFISSLLEVFLAPFLMNFFL